MPKTLKVDRSLVARLSDGDEQGLGLVTSIVQMGHSMGIDITAEGVETERQVQLLKKMGCQTLQGYYLAKPMIIGDLLAFCDQRQRA